MIGRRSMAALIALASVGACALEQEASAPERYPVQLRALSEEGEPLEGVEMLVSGQLLGATDARGRLLVQLPGQEGRQVTFEARCPKGSDRRGEPGSLRLRKLSGPPPEVELTCGRSKRVAALIVSAPGFADLPVLSHDREVARTDASGTAHVLLEGEPSTPLRVVLDTGARPRVIPPSPHKDIQIAARDEIVVFAPELTELPPPPPPRKRKKKEEAPPPVIRPERLR